MPVELDLSVISLVRNAESALPDLLRLSEELRQKISPEAKHELLLFDHDSTDNTLSALQLLSRREPSLRTFAHTPLGTAIKRGARCARGRRWLILDAAPQAKAARWVLNELLDGQPAAAVDGKALGIPRELGILALSWHQGGLWAAQRAVELKLRKQGLHTHRKGWQSQGALGQLKLEIHGRWSRVRPQLRAKGEA